MTPSFKKSPTRLMCVFWVSIYDANRFWFLPLLGLFFFLQLTNSLWADDRGIVKTTASPQLPIVSITQNKTSLEGPWQVIRDKIARPGQFDTHYRGDVTMFPDRWHNPKHSADNENNWPDGFGVASYRLKLHIPEGSPSLSLRLQTPYSAHELWIDGQLVASNGKISDSPEGAKAFYLERRVRLPQTGNVSIVLIVSNFEHAIGGILRPPLVEPSETLEQEARAYDLSYLFVLGALTALLVFHMAYFFRGFTGGQDWSLFWYCVLVTIIIVRLATLNTILFRVFPALPQFSDKTLVYLTLFSASAAYLTFLASIFPKEFPRYIRLITYWGSAPFILSVLILPVHVYTMLQDPFIIFAMLILIYNQCAIIRAWVKKRSGSGSVMLFTIFFLATVINDVMHYLHAFNLRPLAYTDLMPFGFLLLSIGHAIALSARSRALHEHTLSLAKTLQSLNKSLDERVKVKTADAKAAQLDAERSAEEKINFISAASHDLRQPIQALSIFNNNLMKAAHENEELSTIAGKQQHLISSLADMLTTMLEVSRLEAKTLDVTMSPVSLASVFEELKHTFLPIAAQNGVTLRFVPSSRHIWADAKYFRRVLGNLVANAIEAAPEGKVLVGAKLQRSTVKIVVADNGCGISTTDIGAVFNRYVQLDARKRKGQGGLGLGLSIVKEMCSLMEMDVTLTSKYGEGSIFTISAVVVAASTQAVSSAQRAVFEVPASSRRLVILVVDDNADACDALVMMFRGWGHAARGVCSLEAAIETLEDLGPPDLICTDYWLGPDVTGLDVIIKIRQKHPDTPAIIITGATAPEDLQTLKSFGFPYFHKPVDPAAVLQELPK